MISQLTGTVVAVSATAVVVDVGGVGFRALCTPAVASAVRLGKTSTVHTSMVIRDEVPALFAFADADERDAFDLVRSATGIGPKIAQAVVSVLPPAELRAAIAAENVAALTRVPGIGPKGARRLVIELKDKVNTLAAVTAEGAGPVAAAPAYDWRDQVRGGLESLGWSARDAEAACERVEPLAAEHPEYGVGELMKAALRGLAK
ncbi:Holliday junction branch migration protein RuvA [Nigerium massiliense]|uniref:Holliday junction branch migration protein RuvA n=1 Tax=Nigerium massiliense TaxID=1522317 RepID=UPI00058E5DBD|nr:Holliday junction branch migration protein RuvA [Nigerium massiliense]